MFLQGDGVINCFIGMFLKIELTSIVAWSLIHEFQGGLIFFSEVRGSVHFASGGI